jgi:hypothetical protein
MVTPRNQKMETARTQRSPRIQPILTADEVVQDIVDDALQVRRILDPGLLESAYQACLSHEFKRRRHRVALLTLRFSGGMLATDL